MVVSQHHYHIARDLLLFLSVDRVLPHILRHLITATKNKRLSIGSSLKIIRGLGNRGSGCGSRFVCQILPTPSTSAHGMVSVLHVKKYAY